MKTNIYLKAYLHVIIGSLEELSLFQQDEENLSIRLGFVCIVSVRMSLDPSLRLVASLVRVNNMLKPTLLFPLVILAGG